MQYQHAFDHMLPISRSNSIVIDPGVWGHPTTGDRDRVDLGHAHSPRFWNTCADQAQGQPRLINSVDWEQIQYVDFKLFRSSRKCAAQWHLLNTYLTLTHERVLHFVNDDKSLYHFGKFEQQFLGVRRDGNPLHIDVVVKTDDLAQEQQLVDCAYECVRYIPHLTLTVSCVWRKLCYVHVYKHPSYAAGERIVKPY